MSPLPPSASSDQSSLGDPLRYPLGDPASSSTSRSDRARRQHKPIPSPLQVSYSSPVLAHVSRSSTEQPRSPREILDDLIATEKDDFAADEEETPRRRRGFPLTTRKVVPPTAPLSPPTSPNLGGAPSTSAMASTTMMTAATAMATAPAAHRPAPRPIPPRNPSIDSAVSSISTSTTHSYKSTPPHHMRSSADAGPPPDMASLILAAGSPEAALLSLWKEKQSASNHNAQLWRLVEKQRAMILGLNKDLERALKEKERYRKKLKDHMAQVPPLPNQAAPSAATAVDREHSSSPANSDATEDLGPARRAGREPAKGAMAVAMQAAKRPGSESPGGAPMVPPTHSPQISEPASTTDSALSSHEPSPTDMAAPDRPKQPSMSKPTHPTIAQESSKLDAPSIGTSSTLHLREPPNAPSLSLTQATPISETGPFSQPAHERTGSTSVRKAPPKPLDLSNKSIHPSSHLHAAGPMGNDGSDSDYDDDLEVDEIPNVEQRIEQRGRRKTREEDDRIREAQVLAEQEHRSLSKKQAKSKSKSQSASESTSPVDQPKEKTTMVEVGPMPTFVGLPASPRAMHQSGSIAAVLSPGSSSDRSTIQRSVLSTPLMSPGLPVSPRPADRAVASPTARMLGAGALASPPMSPRGTVGLPLSPRAPRAPIPLPLASPLAVTSPHLARAEGYSVHQSHPPAVHVERAPTSQSHLVPPEMDAGSRQSLNDDPSNGEDHIYRRLVSENYPNLLLPPNALPSIQIRVSSSRLRPSRHSMLLARPLEEDPVFLLGVHARSDGRQLWRVEKTIAAIPVFHSALTDALRSSGIGFLGLDAKVPDRSLFAGHAPAKVDARRAAVNEYFESVLDTEMDEKAAIVVCEFLSTDAMGADPDEPSAGGLQVSDASRHASGADAGSAPPKPSGPRGRIRKEGYLTKRGKNFGGWKARYFVLDGPELKYYEVAGGAHLGTIKLISAQIGKQSPQSSAGSSGNSHQDDLDNQYRHAFLILEPKRKDPTNPVRHVLCAESDAERDAWVDALVSYVDYRGPQEAEHGSKDRDRPGSSRNLENPAPGKLQRPVESKSRGGRDGGYAGEPTIPTVSYDNTVAAEAPVRGGTPNFGFPNTHHLPGSPTVGGGGFPPHGGPPGHPPPAPPVISGPTNGSVIRDVELWGNKPAATLTVKDKKRSIFGFRGRSSSDLAPDSLGSQASAQAQRSQQPSSYASHPSSPPRMVFGLPLAEATECSHIPGAPEYLPAVVHRSIEYLRAQGAADEEGIFRLSGSNVVIKGLRERFNTEGDVRLLDGEVYDVHAVASLLKLYLRELPVSILTRELHLDFLKALEIEDRDQRIAAFNSLVHKLPKPNFHLLHALLGFLQEIVSNSDVNKMTVRNVGIVFAPTLNIPATIISLFLTAYPSIFGPPRRPSEPDSPPAAAPAPSRELTVPAHPADGLGIRSPRHQMFSDLPTPSYRETFANGSGAGQQPPHYGGGGYGPSGRLGPETGFIPMHPSYDAPPQSQQQPPQQPQAFNGNYSAWYDDPPAPASASSGTLSVRETKQRRRESSMLMMNMGAQGPRNGSMPRVREEVGMVSEESAFD